jgi:hypothetical protein
MKRYIQELKNRPTHDRRLFALRIAGAVTAIIFVGWIGTLGLRVGNQGAGDAALNNNSSSQTAAAQSGIYGGNQNQLIVSTTTN